MKTRPKYFTKPFSWTRLVRAYCDVSRLDDATIERVAKRASEGVGVFHAWHEIATPNSPCLCAKCAPNARLKGIYS